MQKTKGPSEKRKIINVPFYSQWESRNLVNKFVNKELSYKEDPKWKLSGAKNKKEYELWSNNICGMACLKMILKYKTGTKHKIINLAKLATRYEAYKITKLEIRGMFYDGFVKFIQEQFQMKAKIEKNISLNEIIKYIQNNSLFIASVSKYIREDNYGSVEPGGHLVLVIGYDLNRKKLFINNPSGYYPNKQHKHAVSFTHFNKFFAKRGIAVFLS